MFETILEVAIGSIGWKHPPTMKQCFKNQQYTVGFEDGSFILNKRGAAALHYFPTTVGQKWLKNELFEKFKKNIGSVMSGKARS